MPTESLVREVLGEEDLYRVNDIAGYAGEMEMLAIETEQS